VRILVIALLGISALAAAQSPPVGIPQIAAEQVKHGCFTIDYTPKVAGTLKIDYVINSSPVVQSYSLTLDPLKGPYTMDCVIGPVTYIHFTLTAKDGSMAPLTSTWKIHYPDAPVQVLPAAPTAFKVT
jgi:hypothetical protein